MLSNVIEGMEEEEQKRKLTGGNPEQMNGLELNEEFNYGMNQLNHDLERELSEALIEYELQMNKKKSEEMVPSSESQGPKIETISDAKKEERGKLPFMVATTSCPTSDAGKTESVFDHGDNGAFTESIDDLAQDRDLQQLEEAGLAEESSPGHETQQIEDMAVRCSQNACSSPNSLAKSGVASQGQSPSQSGQGPDSECTIFNCSLCPEKFFRKLYLNNHMEKRHGVKYVFTERGKKFKLVRIPENLELKEGEKLDPCVQMLLKSTDGQKLRGAIGVQAIDDDGEFGIAKVEENPQKLLAGKAGKDYGCGFMIQKITNDAIKIAKERGEMPFVAFSPHQSKVKYLLRITDVNETMQVVYPAQKNDVVQNFTPIPSNLVLIEPSKDEKIEMETDDQDSELTPLIPLPGEEIKQESLLKNECQFIETPTNPSSSLIESLKTDESDILDIDEKMTKLFSSLKRDAIKAIQNDMTGMGKKCDEAKGRSESDPGDGTKLKSEESSKIDCKENEKPPVFKGPKDYRIPIVAIVRQHFDEQKNAFIIMVEEPNSEIISDIRFLSLEEFTDIASRDQDIQMLSDAAKRVAVVNKRKGRGKSFEPCQESASTESLMTNHPLLKGPRNRQRFLRRIDRNSSSISERVLQEKSSIMKQDVSEYSEIDGSSDIPISGLHSSSCTRVYTPPQAIPGMKSYTFPLGVPTGASTPLRSTDRVRKRRLKFEIHKKCKDKMKEPKIKDSGHAANISGIQINKPRKRGRPRRIRIDEDDDMEPRPKKLTKSPTSLKDPPKKEPCTV